MIQTRLQSNQGFFRVCQHRCKKAHNFGKLAEKLVKFDENAFKNNELTTWFKKAASNCFAIKSKVGEFINFNFEERQKLRYKTLYDFAPSKHRGHHKIHCCPKLTAGLSYTCSFGFIASTSSKVIYKNAF